jgi:predicted lipoprotein with Yx(FWY)xxD motif
MRFLAACALLAATLAIQHDASSQQALTYNPPPGGATIAVGRDHQGNAILTANGVTVYAWDGDSTRVSNCSGSCAQTWPPVTSPADKPFRYQGINGNPILRQPGQPPSDSNPLQAAVNEFPLYTFSGDVNPGDTNGNCVSSFGAQWHTLDQGGRKSSCSQ